MAVAAATLALPAAAGAQDAAAMPAPACASADAPIDEARFVSIGGIDQWVTISGRRCGNPVLLFLHGGPGNPLSPYADGIFGQWTRDFTLVQWDQRGAGRTFGRNPQTEASPLTVRRMTDDGVALAEYLSARIGQPIVIVAGSWGSVIGIHMIKARPDLFRAYVGFAQIVGSRQNQQATYTRLATMARASGDAATRASLDAIGPPPWTDPRNPGIVRRITRTYEAGRIDAAPREWWTRAAGYDTPAMEAEAEAGEEYSYLQFVGRDGTGMFAGIDLPALGPDYRVPMFFVQGAEDLVTVPEVTQGFADAIVAPAKELVTVPRAGHDPNRPMIAAIEDLLVRRVRPLTR